MNQDGIVRYIVFLYYLIFTWLKLSLFCVLGMVHFLTFLAISSHVKYKWLVFTLTAVLNPRGTGTLCGGRTCLGRLKT